ncbi:MAG TPA: SAM-dependent chlorinase/fluorinase [Gemmatimonadales bacterium]|nr:SAM-dependent chlorinase/fluorinase [Gemmatimonadales bacterium]
MPVLTFLTDYGLADSYVAEVKGAILALHPEAPIVDLTHLVPPGSVASGAYLLGRSCLRFPAGSVHLAVVDPGVGTARAGIAFRAHGHAFVGPDNGLFTEVLGGLDGEVIALDVPEHAAPTFHGRDVFGPAAARLLMGYPPAALGRPLGRAPVVLPQLAPFHDGLSLVGEVIHVDGFGTLVTNIPAALVPHGALVWYHATTIGPLHRTFADVATGELLALAGSGGHLEIAVRDGSAAARLGAGLGSEVRVRPPGSPPGSPRG